MAFKRAIIDRKPSLRILISGNPLTESTIATVNDWQIKCEQFEVEPVVVVEAEVPKQEEERRQPQYDFLQKELFVLRQQHSSMQTVLNDKQRQLDTSAFRITELEQHLARETYRVNTTNDALQEALLRISILNDQLSSLTTNWDKDRTALTNEYSNQLKLKEKIIRDVTLEFDDCKAQRNELAVRLSLYLMIVEALFDGNLLIESSRRIDSSLAKRTKSIGQRKTSKSGNHQSCTYKDPRNDNGG